MQPTRPLITALLLTPLAAFAQAKPEVTNATKAAKRAWESAPAEKKALWQQQRDALINIDLSEDTQRQIVIARGSPKPDESTPFSPPPVWPSAPLTASTPKANS